MKDLTNPAIRLREAHYTGTSADGLVTVELRGGRVVGSSIDPRTIQGGVERIGKALTEATNDALGQAFRAVDEEFVPAGTGSLPEQVAAVQEEARTREIWAAEQVRNRMTVIAVVSAHHEGRHYI